MNKQTLARRWDHVRQQYGVYLRLLEALPEDRLHDHPIAGMRTPAELIAHTSGAIVRDIARGIATGEIKHSEEEAKAASKLTTRAEVVAYARKCWDEAAKSIGRVGDSELDAMVATPWNMSFPGSAAFTILTDEFLHHRGQLYAYVRACGGETPFLWSFDENAPGFTRSA